MLSLKTNFKTFWRLVKGQSINFFNCIEIRSYCHLSVYQSFLRPSLQKIFVRFTQSVLRHHILNFLWTFLSIWSLNFLNFLKSLFLRFNFSNTSPLNHLWVFPFTHLLLQGAIFQYLPLTSEINLNKPH